MKAYFIQAVEKLILPSTFVIAAKLGAIFILSVIFPVVWTLDFGGDAASLFLLSFQDTKNLPIVSSLSDLAAITVCAIGFSWVIFRFVHFGPDNIHPATQAKLLHKKQHFLMINDRETVYQGAGWWLLSWLVLLLTAINTLAGATSVLVFGLGLGITLVLSSCLFLGAKKFI